MYPTLRYTKGGMRLELEQGTGKYGHQYVEISLWIWYVDTGWGWICSHLTDSRPCMLASHPDHLRMLLRRAYTPLAKIKKRESFDASLEHLSHTFPSKLPDLSLRAQEVHDALPRRSLAPRRTSQSHRR